MNNTADTLFALLRMKLCPHAVRDQHPLSEDDLHAIYSLAKAHDLTQFAAAALTDLGLLSDSEISRKFKNSLLMTMWRYEKLTYELGQITMVLEKNGIDFMPLKGAVIRPYYAEPWMRTSCDIDFLVREEDIDRATNILVQELGYTQDAPKGVHHLSMRAPNGIHLEPHFCLRENSDTLDPVLDEVWNNCSLADGYEHCYYQSPEFMLFHILAHMTYHFQHGGCGIKPFIDLYLLQERLDYDRDRFMDFCHRAGIAQFYARVCEVIDVWFKDAPHTEITRHIEQYVLSGGVYGTKSNAVAMQQERSGNKVRHFFQRIFLPYKYLKIKYPILVRHAWLMPVFQIARWMELLQKKEFRKYSYELSMICNLNDDRRSDIRRLLDECGLSDTADETSGK